ncbi:LysR family transcriptional regulator [Variovorax dokdonensis]|uniref:LysR family transcriptional regulator n=1 Tax=Variovorax dokdonensis TaxID=344883 RepID=A0ABT7NAA6_9BURK|nr:LysR family transcriptional regulator [Variovorax dokdonensis]MDM0044795.1 LysR family transcriptional regulator [Variovorax dokdonensis]
MARVEINRAAEMEVFVRVVERGGFSAAARSLNMTPSAVSKLIARLEARLGTQLVRRSTRALDLTQEGEQFYERCVRVLADIDEAERSLSAAAAPRGRVTINTSTAFGHLVVAPLLPRLMALYPELAIDLAVTDRVVDLLEARADIAVRWGPLPASDLVARRLGATTQSIVASPQYLERHGTPRRPEDLTRHLRLDFTYRRRVPDWPFIVGAESVAVSTQSSLRAGDGETLRMLALEGAGLARLSDYQTHADRASGHLVRVLQEFNPCELEPIHAVYLGRPGRLPARVRAVLDFLQEQLRGDPRFVQG